MHEDVLILHEDDNYYSTFQCLHYKNYTVRNCSYAAVHYWSCPRIHGILKYNNYSVERYVTFYWTILYEDNDI